MRARLVRVNDRRLAAGKPAIDMGVGLHTGELVAGNIGTSDRMEYTVIGDTVNVASRLESLTKTLDRSILVSRTTANLLPETIKLEEVSTMEVKGRLEPVTIFAVAER